MLKRALRIIHSMIWWVDWCGIVLLGIFFDSVIWPGNRHMYRQAERFWAWTLMKLGGIKLDVYGRDNLPQNETVVYMANHQSDLDWPIIFRTIPGQYLFLAKKELFSLPIFGTYMKIQQYIPIERTKIRKSLKTYQKIISLIKAGNSIVIYPEGTRSYTEELQRFKLFSFSFLREAKVRVVPVAIDGSIHIQKKGSRLINPGKVNVNILPPVSFDDLYDLENKEFCIAAANRVREVLLLALGQNEKGRIKWEPGIKTNLTDADHPENDVGFEKMKVAA
jgi:1-acyl-sn-glycerol-3-phosphate acyltransferase